MADNLTMNSGSGGSSIAADDISSVFYPRCKLIHGADGVNSGDVSTSNPFPTDLRQIVGTAAAVGAGAVSNGVQRMTLASDDPAVVDLAALEALIIGCFRGLATPTINTTLTTAVITGAANTADQDVIAAVASKQIWIYGICGAGHTATGTVLFEDSNNTAMSAAITLTAGGVLTMAPSGNYAMPIMKLATGFGLRLTTVTCGFNGFITYATITP